MGRIAQLPEAVANQIAAGEVVERPASVVKELVENALDAEAGRVRVEVTDGGVERIVVTDDGTGMSREDAELCLARHATSKIRRVEDLSSVLTLGFRGEAIPSIASVSRFVLTTRARGDAEATRVEVAGGKLESVSAVGAPVGTTIEVADLFYNVPARRKFLKQPATEIGHVSEAIEQLALARSEIAFTLLHGARTLLDAPPASATDPRGRLGRILGREIADRLFPIPVPDEQAGGARVSGFISAPDLSERTQKGLHVFVNGRYVRDRTITHAIGDAYRTLLERGRFPVVVLSVDLDPGAVDVNVHPQKVEVRFADSSAVHRAVTRALTRALAAQPWLAGFGALASATQPAQRYVLRPAEEPLSSPPRTPAPNPGVAEALIAYGRARGAAFSPPAGARGTPEPAFAGTPGPGAPAPGTPQPSAGAPVSSAGALVFPGAPASGAAAPGAPAFPGAPVIPGAAPGPVIPGAAPSAPESSAGAPVIPGAAPSAPESSAGTPVIPGAAPSAPESSAGKSAPDAVILFPAAGPAPGGAGRHSPVRFAALEPVGQVLATYLVCEGQGRVVMIDQHAAHERIAFERMRRQVTACGTVAAQALLVPRTIELDASRAAVASAEPERLLALGFELEPFGGATWLLKSVPATLGAGDHERLLRDVLDELAEVGQSTPAAEAIDAVLSRAACHCVVRAGDRLGREEIRALLVQMDEIDFGAHCPHGRPVFVEWTERELGRMFHRT